MKEMVRLFFMEAMKPAGIGQISGLVHFAEHDGTVEDGVRSALASGW